MGEEWGDNGYGYLSYKYIINRAAFSFWIMCNRDSEELLTNESKGIKIFTIKSSNNALDHKIHKNRRPYSNMKNLAIKSNSLNTMNRDNSDPGSPGTMDEEYLLCIKLANLNADIKATKKIKKRKAENFKKIKGLQEEFDETMKRLGELCHSNYIYRNWRALVKHKNGNRESDMTKEINEMVREMKILSAKYRRSFDRGSNESFVFSKVMRMHWLRVEIEKNKHDSLFVRKYREKEAILLRNMNRYFERIALTDDNMDEVTDIMDRWGELKTKLDLLDRYKRDYQRETDKKRNKLNQMIRVYGSYDK